MMKHISLLLSALVLYALVLTAGLASVAFASGAQSETDVNLGQGTVQVYDFGDLKLHAYQTDDTMGDECFVMETDTNLVAIESPSFKVNVEEWKAYLAGLKKPLTDIILAYHPAGGRWFGDATSHATAKAEKSMTQGAVKELTDTLALTYGDDFVADIPAIDSTIKNGPVTVGGVRFDILEVDDGCDIAIPAISAVYTHMLGADGHSILADLSHMDSILRSLERLKARNYRLILSGHHTPEKLSDLDAKITYVKTVRQLAKTSKGRNEFIDAVMKAFPDFKGLDYLIMTGDALFPAK